MDTNTLRFCIEKQGNLEYISKIYGFLSLKALAFKQEQEKALFEKCRKRFTIHLSFH